MTNTYAINTTRGKEFEVEQDLREIGLHPWLPKRRDSRYVKEARKLRWYDRPYVHKLMFCVIPAVYWPNVVKQKHVIGKPYALSKLDMQGDPSRKAPGLTQFRNAVDREYDDACRREANAEYECQFAPGQALELLSGPFEGFRAEFKQVIRRAHDDYSKLQVSVQVFGRETPVEIDPDKVRAGSGSL